MDADADVATAVFGVPTHPSSAGNANHVGPSIPRNNRNGAQQQTLLFLQDLARPPKNA